MLVPPRSHLTSDSILMPRFCNRIRQSGRVSRGNSKGEVTCSGSLVRRDCASWEDGRLIGASANKQQQNVFAYPERTETVISDQHFQAEERFVEFTSTADVLHVHASLHNSIAVAERDAGLIRSSDWTLAVVINAGRGTTVISRQQPAPRETWCRTGHSWRLRRGPSPPRLADIPDSPARKVRPLRPRSG